MFVKLIIVSIVAFVAIIAKITFSTIDLPELPDNPDVNTTLIHYVTVRTALNVNLQVIQMGENDLNKPLLVFLHGFPETALLSWHRQLNYLGSMNKYFILAPDMRGYNKSDKPKNMMDYQYPHLVADIHSLIHDYAGRKQAYVVGHDWGAIVAWKLAQKFPQSVMKLVIMNVPHPAALKWLLSTSKWEVIMNQLKKSWYIFYFQLPWPIPEYHFSSNNYSSLKAAQIQLGNKNITSSKILARYSQAYSEPGALHSMINYYRCLIIGRFITTLLSLVEKYPMIEKYMAKDDLPVEVPTMIIWGTDDFAIEFELGKLSWEKGISASVKDKSRFCPIEGTGHFVQHEQSAKVNQLLLEFLQ